VNDIWAHIITRASGSWLVVSPQTMAIGALLWGRYICEESWWDGSRTPPTLRNGFLFRAS